MSLETTSRALFRVDGRVMADAEGGVPDGVLARRHVEGDPDALRDLVARHETAVLRWIDRGIPAAVRRRVAADDVLQETWIVVARRISEFEDRGEGAFRGWVIAIAMLKLREALRRETEAARRDVEMEVSRGARPDTAAFAGRDPSPSAHAVANELSAAVARAAERLRPDDREILRLVQSEGLKLEEAAERTGRSREAARKLYERALERFAALVEDERGRS